MCCLASEDEETKEDVPNELKRENLDRVEQAFRKFDLDHDGYLSWQEFKQVNTYLDLSSFLMSSIHDNKATIGSKFVSHLFTAAPQD